VVAVELPFPGGHQATEAVEGVASASSFAALVEATSQLRPAFEEALGALRPPAREPAYHRRVLGRRARRPERVVPGRVRVRSRRQGGVHA
jgi:hypothetical protein